MSVVIFNFYRLTPALFVISVVIFNFYRLSLYLFVISVNIFICDISNRHRLTLDAQLPS